MREKYNKNKFNMKTQNSEEVVEKYNKKEY